MRALRVVIAGMGMSVLLAAGPGCSPATRSGAPLSTLMVTWPEYFRIDWQPADVGGRTIIRGTVYNISPYRTKRIQLLIDGLDASGAIVNQRVEFLGTEITPGDHVYFESPTPGPAASYRVSVFAFDPIRPT
jgi:hypothetical protein